MLLWNYTFLRNGVAGYRDKWDQDSILRPAHEENSVSILPCYADSYKNMDYGVF